MGRGEVHIYLKHKVWIWSISFTTISGHIQSYQDSTENRLDFVQMLTMIVVKYLISFHLKTLDMLWMPNRSYIKTGDSSYQCIWIYIDLFDFI